MDLDVLCQAHSKCLPSGEAFQMAENDEDLKLRNEVSRIRDSSTLGGNFGFHSIWAQSPIAVVGRHNQRIRPDKTQKPSNVFQQISICRRACTCHQLTKDVNACRPVRVDSGKLEQCR